MDNFIVSARKYRPLSFDTVVGQGSITNTLKNAIKSNHLAHAYLFCGPRGVGKTTCARIFAKTINCVNLSEEIEACGQCESCKSFSENRSYNIHELDAASNNSVEDIRNLTDQVRIPPQVGKYSVYIIDEVHMLSQQAFNAFLKTLEEPPKHALFILATTEKHKIIPTILSRCQIYDFNRMGIENMVGHLERIAQEEAISFEPEAFNVIAQKADGAMRDALSIFDQIVSFSGNQITYKKVIENLNILDYEYYFKLVDAFLENKVPEAMLIFNEILDKGFDAHNFINGLSKHMRDLLVIKSPSTIQLIDVGPAIKEKYKDQTAKCSNEFIYDVLQITNDSDLGYKISKDKRLHVELALVKLCNVTLVQKKKLEQLAKAKKSDSGKNGAEQRKENEVPSNTDKKPVRVQKVSTPSIKEALNNIESPKVVNEPEAGQISKENVTLENKAFELDQLNEKWSEFSEKVKNKSRRMHIALKNKKPEIVDGAKIRLALDNTAQQEEFGKEVKADLVSFLRESLGNSKVEVEVYVEESTTTPKRAYTDSDKFEVMSKKNPALNKLKNELNLDFE